VTPAVELLRKLGVPHHLHRFEAARASPSYGEAAAAALGVAKERVLKTLIAELAGGELVAALVPVDRSLDLALLARAAGAKSARMATPAAAERATGYVTGGISPFGQRRRLRVFVDRTANLHRTVFVSGGRRGLELEVAPPDLVRMVGATIARLTA
jgi:Cys-tRNA(Pro)/Cys-tRNA(Cys) deacylase